MSNAIYSTRLFSTRLTSSDVPLGMLTKFLLNISVLLASSGFLGDKGDPCLSSTSAAAGYCYPAATGAAG